MSRSTLLNIRGREYDFIAEFSNSFGTAPIVWKCLYDRFCEKHEYKFFMQSGEIEKVWSIFNREDVPKEYRAVLGLHLIALSLIGRISKDWLMILRLFFEFLDMAKVSIISRK